MIAEHEDDLRNATSYRSKQNPDFFTAYYTEFGNLVTKVDQIKRIEQEARAIIIQLQAKQGEFDGERDRVWDALARELDEIMGRRALRWRSREVHSAPAVFCAPLLQDVVAGGIRATLPPRSDAPPAIFSRAGHDGMSLGAVTDVGMLFLRNPDGVSHHPDESVSAGDVAHGIRALAEAVLLRGTEPI